MFYCPYTVENVYKHVVDIIDQLPEPALKTHELGPLQPVLYGLNSLRPCVSNEWDIIMTPKQTVVWLSQNPTRPLQTILYTLYTEGIQHHKLDVLLFNYIIHITIITHTSQGMCQVAIESQRFPTVSILSNPLDILQVRMAPFPILEILLLVHIQFQANIKNVQRIEIYIQEYHTLRQKNNNSIRSNNRKIPSPNISPKTALYPDISRLLFDEAVYMHGPLTSITLNKTVSNTNVDNIVDRAFVLAIYKHMDIKLAYRQALHELCVCANGYDYIDQYPVYLQPPLSFLDQYNHVQDQLCPPWELYFNPHERKLAQHDASRCTFIDKMDFELDCKSSIVMIYIDKETYAITLNYFTSPKVDTVVMHLTYQDEMKPILEVDIHKKQAQSIVRCLQVDYITVPHDILYLLRLACGYLKTDQHINIHLKQSADHAQRTYSSMIGKCSHHVLTLLYIDSIQRHQVIRSLNCLKSRIGLPLLPIRLSRFRYLQEVTRYHKHNHDPYYSFMDGPILHSMIQGDVLSHYFHEPNEIKEASLQSKFIQIGENKNTISISLNQTMYCIRIKTTALSVSLYCNESRIHRIKWIQDNQGYTYLDSISSVHYMNDNTLSFLIRLALIYLSINEHNNLATYLDYFIRKGIQAQYFQKEFQNIIVSRCHPLFLTYIIGIHGSKPIVS
jgi:hypothetical protein